MGLKNNIFLASKESGSSITFLKIKGMSCSNCRRQVEQALKSVEGVKDVTVELEKGTATVVWENNLLPSPQNLLLAIKNAGYSAKVITLTNHKEQGWYFNLIVAGLATLLIVVGELVINLEISMWFRWTEFILATIVQIFAGGKFYQGALSQLKVARANMDSLVVLGTTAAYLYSLWILLSGQPHHLYFMEAAAIITIVSFGHWLEARLSAKASKTLHSLIQLVPTQATKIDVSFYSNKTNLTLRDLNSLPAKKIPIGELSQGDLVVINPGDSIPTDGIVIAGKASVDESMLTGESNPVEKSPTDRVFAGTLNLDGQLIMQVTHTGEHTVLAKIIAAIKQAQSTRANIQRLADRISNVFVPTIILVAIATGLWWAIAPEQAQQIHLSLTKYLWTVDLSPNPLARAIIFAVAVLIVACPCAMGIATPAALVAATNSAAQRGILLTDAIALEKARKISSVLLDKTRTLTSGKSIVAEAIDLSLGTKIDFKLTSPDKILSSPAIVLASSLAKNSSHPISSSISKLTTRYIPFDQIKEIRGKGIEGICSEPEATKLGLDSNVISLGSIQWLAQKGVVIEPIEEFMKKWISSAATVIGCAVGTKLVGAFAIVDQLKPTAKELVKKLKQMGLKVYIVSGDNQVAVQTIAKELNIPPEHIFSEINPEHKARIVQELQNSGESVAFVGDGINDGPALEQADLGIAVSQATDVAKQAADIVLINSDIEAIPKIIELAHATLRIIKQNLFWAFFYNSLAIPLASLGFLSPIVCAFAMGISDLVVIGNSLRLLRR